MACQYWYDGQWRSEEEFKNILNEGLLDSLIKDNKINIEGLEMNPQSVTAKKEPVTLRILHKIQTKINNERGSDNQFVNNNPVDILVKAEKESGKKTPLKIIIKIKDQIKVGKGETNKKILEELSHSEVFGTMSSNLKEGVPYMLVPSAYGLYPVQLKSHKLKDTKLFPIFKNLLNSISTAKNSADVLKNRIELEKILYRTTIERLDNELKVTIFNTTLGKAVEKKFTNQEDVITYLQDKLVRLDADNINTGQYNTIMSQNGAITTDLFSENGNFFHSSSFVLEAYQMSEENKKTLDAIFTTKLAVPLNFSSTFNTKDTPEIKNPVASSTSADIKAVSIPKQGEIQKDIYVGNSNFPYARITYSMETDTPVVKEVVYIQKQKRQNANDLIVVSPGKTTSHEFQEATKLFFALPEIQKLKGTITKVETEEESTNEQPKSIIKSALSSMIDTSVKEDGSQMPPVEDMQDLSSLVSTSKNNPKVSEELDTFDGGFDTDFDGEDLSAKPDTKFRITSKKENAVLWDQKQELEWLEKSLGNSFVRGGKGNLRVFKNLESIKAYLPKETYEMLLESRKNGKELHGVFTSAAILLSKTALPGTTYHEAFHAVFNLALPLHRRVEILNEALDKYEKEIFSLYGNNPTFEQIEEVLADKFMDYTEAREKIDESLPTKIKNFFKGLFRMINTFYHPNKKVVIDKLFEDINLGVYKHNLTFLKKKNIKGHNIKLREINPHLKYENPSEEAEAFTYMSHVIDKIVDQYKSKTEKNHLNDKEVISEIGVDKLYALLLTQIYEDVSLNVKNNNDSAPSLIRLWNILTLKQSQVKQTEIEHNGETKKVLMFKESTDLLERFNHSLQLRGLYISLNKINTTKDIAQDSEIDFSNDEESTGEERWMRGHIEINPAESISQRLKSFFATIPKYTSNRKNARPLINRFGVQEKENGGQVFKYLIGKISNSYTMEDMINKLKALESKKPYISHILEQIAKDPILRTELWVSVASKNFATYKTVQEDNGTYKVFNSNRKQLKDIIQDELISNFLFQGNPLFNKDASGKTDFESPNKEAVDKYLSTMKEALQYLSVDILAAADANRVTLMNEAISNLSKSISKIGINLTEEDLESIWNPSTGKASWNNIPNLIKDLIKLGEKLQEGENPFLSLKPDEESFVPKERKDKSLLESLGKKLIPALDKEIVASFRNTDGKTVYNLILSGFINKQFDKFTNTEKREKWLESIQEDPLLKSLPFVKDLANEETGLSEKLDVVLLDGLARKGKKQSVSYSDMSDIELESTSMALFHNNGSKTRLYKLPIPSDAPTIMYVEANKYTNEEIINKLVDTAKAEFNRIIKLKNTKENSLLRKIPNYFNKGTKFQVLSFLNGKIDTNKGFNEEQVKTIITDFLNNKFLTDHINSYKRKGIITTVNKETGKIVFAEKAIDSTIKDSTEFFKNYLFSTFYMNTQLSTIIGGDPSFYKNTVDYQKRYKQVLSPGSYTSTESIRTHYNAIILNDSEVPTTKENVDTIIELIKSSNLTTAEKQELTVLWTALGKGGNNESDAATYISIDRYEEILKSLGRWNDSYEASAKRVREGNETIEDIANFPPLKPFVFNHNNVEGIIVPTQIKNAEVLLTKSMALRKSNDKIMFPKLEAIYKLFESGTVDTAIFESAIKVGSVGNSIENNKVRFTDLIKQKDGSFIFPENMLIHSLKTEDWRLQQETPPHYVDESGNFGTQLRNLIIGDMDLEGTYNVSGKSMMGKEVVKLYQELIIQDLKTSFENVQEMFETKEGKIDYEKLAYELRKEVIDRDMGQEYLDALELIENDLGEIETALPLYHPLIAYKMEAIMNSFFKNRVTKQKIAGGAVVNTTSYGVSEHLKMKVEKDGKITMEVMMPWSSRKYFPLDENGEVDFKTIQEKAPELLQVIGYRIPTEDKYSMFNIKIVGFTPPAMGGTMIMPVEVTTLAGLDFDIDKLYIMTRSFTINKFGNPIYTKYKEDVDSIAKDIYKNFKSYKEFVTKHVKEKDQEKMLEGRRKTIDDRINTRKEKNEELNNIKEEIKELKNQKQSTIQIYGRDSKEASYIQNTIDEKYKSIEEELLPYNEQLSVINEKEQEVIDFINKKLIEIKFNPLEYNTKQARDNKKLEIIKGILENKNTAMSILNPGNFDSLKEQAAKIRLLQNGKVKESKLKGKELIKKADELDNEDFNINYPATQLELFGRNMMGKQLIGIFANHNTHHAKAQYTNLQLKDGIYFNDTLYYKLNNVFNEKGIRISKSLATDLAAVVDNAKEPLSAFLNMNTFTANSIALFQRLGIDNDTIFAFVNQPVLLELSQKHFNEKGSLADEKHFDEIKQKWKKSLETKLVEAGIDVKEMKTNTDLSLKELEENLYPSNTIEYYEVQYRTMLAFEKYHKIANELRQGIAAAKADTQGVGPISGANYVMINNQQKLLNKINRDENLIIGLDEIFKGGNDQIMMPAFSKYGLWKPINVLNKIFPAIGIVNDNGNVSYSSLGLLKNWFSEQKGDMSNLTEKEAQMIDTHYINFISSSFPFFNYSQNEEITKNLPTNLISFKRSIPKDAPYKMFIDSLYVVEPSESIPVKHLEFYNTGKTSLDIQRIIKSWERMMVDTDPNVKKMAFDLVKYTYFANGYGYGPFSFANLIPVKFWTDQFQIENNILDNKGRTFNKFLKAGLDKDFLKVDPVSFDRFVKQFVQNNANKEGFVKTVKAKNIKSILPKAILNVEERDYEYTKAAKEDTLGIIKTAKGSLIINKSKNKNLLFTETRNNSSGELVKEQKPVRFIKIYTTKGKYELYEHMPSKYDMKNTAMYEGKKGMDTITYVPIAILGTTNFGLEYNFNADINISNLKINNKKKVVEPTPVTKALSDTQEADEANAGMLEALVGEEYKKSETPTTIPIKSSLFKNLIDTELTEKMGIFDKINYDDYVQLGGTMSKEEFLAQPEEEQRVIIDQLKNC